MIRTLSQGCLECLRVREQEEMHHRPSHWLGSLSLYSYPQVEEWRVLGVKRCWALRYSLDKLHKEIAWAYLLAIFRHPSHALSRAIQCKYLNSDQIVLKTKLTKVRLKDLRQSHQVYFGTRFDQGICLNLALLRLAANHEEDQAKLVLDLRQQNVFVQGSRRINLFSNLRHTMFSHTVGDILLNQILGHIFNY